jgi:hypothetical protein
MGIAYTIEQLFKSLLRRGRGGGKGGGEGRGGMARVYLGGGGGAGSDTEGGPLRIRLDFPC